MSEAILIEQLNDAIDAIVLSGGVSTLSSDSELGPLVRTALDLRDLPRPDFKAKLRNDLQRSTVLSIATVSTKLESGDESPQSKVNPIREGFHTVTPYIAVREARELIEFVKKAFDAEGAILGTGSEGGIHGEFRIGDSMLMIGGGEAYDRTPNLTGLHYYVPDVDVVYERAIAAGASSLHAPVDQFYGDREAGVKDVAGNYWYIATHQGKSYVPEGLRSVTTFLHPKGAHEFIDFLKNAFDAEQISRYDSPDGRVAHATIRIGDSVIEMGETHGEFQPMSTMFLLYVEDVDFWYRRAVKAGAVLISEPADQPYGDRTAGVSDSFGNTWYMATHIKDVKF